MYIGESCGVGYWAQVLRIATILYSVEGQGPAVPGPRVQGHGTCGAEEERSPAQGREEASAGFEVPTASLNRELK